MLNPSLIFCDSDALTQFLIADELRPFYSLKKAFGIQPVIVAEVENEIKSNKKYKSRTEPKLNKAIHAGTITIFDMPTLHSCLGNASTSIASITWSQVQSQGAQYNYHVGLGEAYTFAAAVLLGQPALSHDMEAIQTLEINGLPLPSPVVRAFDLITLAYQISVMNEADCDSFRQAMMRSSEWVPKAFSASSFKNGVGRFCCRLVDYSSPGIGIPGTGLGYAKQITIKRV